MEESKTERRIVSFTAAISAAMAWLLTTDFYVHEDHLLHVVASITYSSLPPSSYLVSWRTQRPTASFLSLSRSLTELLPSSLYQFSKKKERVDGDQL